jgi:TolB-like protein
MLYRFDRFELDLDKAELRAAGALCPIEPQVFALLAFLVEHRERLVSRDEIFERVWDGRIVSDSALSSRIKSARRALGDDGSSQRFIRTLHGKGFRFVADARIEPSASALAGPEIAADRADASTAPHAAGSRPSLAVLPFRQIGRAGPNAHVAEALPHEIITELARLRWLFVTARGSSFRFRSAEVDVGEVGRLLGVHYCLMGTVEESGRRIVVTVQLADTSSSDVVWSERYAGALDDIHPVRESIRAGVLTALEVRIPVHEAARARLLVTEHLDAWSCYHLGLQHMYRFNRQDNEAAAGLFGRAVTLDPGFARAHAGLSFTHFQTAFMHQSADIAGETALARRCAERGLELDPLDPFVNFTMGRSFWLDGDLDRGLAWLERATGLSPNYAQGIYARAWTETLAGSAVEGRGHVDLAMRLSPLDPLFYAMLGTRALGHMQLGEDAEAAAWADRAARSPGAHVLIALIAAVAHCLAGNAAQARSWADNVHQRNPALTRDDFFRSFPIRSEPMRSRVLDALVRLGC